MTDVFRVPQSQVPGQVGKPDLSAGSIGNQESELEFGAKPVSFEEELKKFNELINKANDEFGQAQAPVNQDGALFTGGIEDTNPYDAAGFLKDPGKGF